MTLLVAVTMLVTAPGRARAHGPVNPAASDYLARIRTVPAGLRAVAIDGDLRLWLHVDPGRRVSVLDEQGAPYVRFGPAGIALNEASAMYYLNQTPPEIPSTRLTAHARPHWRHVSSGDSFEWHDGRLHALAITFSPPGTRDLGGWTIPLRIDGRRAEITGVLDRAPRPSAGWWWPIAVALLGLPAILRLGDRRLDRLIARGLSWPALAAFGVLSVAAGLHGRPGLARSRLAELAVELLFCGWAARRLGRRRDESVVFFLVGFAAIFRGIAAVTVLWRGYVLLALPALVSRASVVVCLAAGCGLLLTTVALSSPARPAPRRGARPPRVSEKAPVA